MKRTPLLVITVLLLSAAGSLVAQQDSQDVSSLYDVASGWLKTVAKERTIYPVTVFAESENRVYIGIDGTSAVSVDRGNHGEFNPKAPGAKVDHEVFVVNQEGKVIDEWSKWSDRFGMVNKITINPYDSDKNVWIIDGATQQVMEFSHDGKDLISSFGEMGVAGTDEKHFDGPADICWLPDGTFFIADGFRNNRIVKFDKNGKYLTAWGRKGSGQGEFNHPQSIAVDARRHLWVADRGNGRVQIFDENGKFLDQWTDFKGPDKVEITQDDAVWLWDGLTARFAEYDMKGKLVSSWTADVGRSTKTAKDKNNVPSEKDARPGDFSVDPQGNLYVVNKSSGTIDKFVPKKNADKNRLVGQPYFLDVATTTY